MVNADSGHLLQYILVDYPPNVDSWLISILKGSAETANSNDIHQMEDAHQTGMQTAVPLFSYLYTMYVKEVLDDLWLL